MAEQRYKSIHSGAQIDAAITKINGGEIDASVQKAAEYAQQSKNYSLDSKNYATSAKNYSESAESDADRAESARESIVIDEQKLKQYATSAETNATESESWAVGGTGTRPGEDENNAKYWADKAQSEAESVTVPPAANVYNLILTDRNTGEKYALLVESGKIKILGVADTLEATEMTLIDSETGKNYALLVESGVLKLEEG